MGNSSLITEDGRQWIIDETNRLDSEISTFGSNIVAFGSYYNAQINAFVSDENAARNSFVSSFQGQFWNFYVNGTNAINAHTGMKTMEVHGARVITSTYIDAAMDTVSTRVLEIATSGGTLYSPLS